jgi:hypothetical protein
MDAIILTPPTDDSAAIRAGELLAQAEAAAAAGLPRPEVDRSEMNGVAASLMAVYYARAVHARGVRSPS